MSAFDGEIKMATDDYLTQVQHDHAAYSRQWLIDNGLDTDFEVVVAKYNELFLDYDRTTLPQTFETTKSILEQALGQKVEYEVSTSKSGNLHVVVTLPEYMDISRRVAWQGAFGSDPKREALHLLSIRRNESNPILFYQRKKQLLLKA